MMMIVTNAQFMPAQWFGITPVPTPDLEHTDRPEEVFTEVDIMWVYKMNTQQSYWSVGFFSPSGDWHEDSTHMLKDEAAARCRWLNGGNA